MAVDEYYDVRDLSGEINYDLEKIRFFRITKVPIKNYKYSF